MQEDYFSYRHEPEVLRHLDVIRFSRFHVRVLLASGLGFMTSTYHVFVLSTIEPMLAFSIYYAEPYQAQSDTTGTFMYGVLPITADMALKSMMVLGIMTGSLCFGYASDHYGRKRLFGFTQLLVVAFSVTDVLISLVLGEYANSTWHTVVLSIFRFLVGVTMGGDIPISAVLASEYASVYFRGRFLALVFLFQGIGLVLAVSVALIVLICFSSQIMECQIHEPCEPLGACWRICLAFGTVPALITFWLRKGIPESPRYTLHVLDNVEQAYSDVEHVMEGHAREQIPPTALSDRITWQSLYDMLQILQNRKWLMGLCFSWFLLDVVFFSQTLFMPQVMEDLGTRTYVTERATGTDIYNMINDTLRLQLLLNLMGTLPGYLFSVIFIERLGRRAIQYLGFIMMTILLVIIASLYNSLSNWLFINLYSFLLFFCNFGPNATTFVVPAEMFKTKFRCTTYALAASCGQLGALFGTVVLGYFMTESLTRSVMAILAFMSALGVMATQLIPEPAGKSLEELSGDKDSAEYMFANESAMAIVQQINTRQMDR